ncbi:GH25 family lysozyme [Lactobacillus sp. Sy-1]|uniref:GH25 family lysozyme n=1 Tax=Lactobacillus sp. Sy-1 TaxID=2109645 RepID=UPI001C582590|nr:GH25 family lysozyme [Lactobacillus sp. Sy-1]MBW1605369.1 hypothetical protein [Lactobacillus sp. Sy-1]
MTDSRITRRSRLARNRRYHRLMGCFNLILMIGIGYLLMMGFNGYQNYQTQKLNRYPIRGVTVSQQNSYVDFISLANAGEKFIYIRASQGSIYTDNDFADNYQRSQGSNLKIGVYHSFSFNSSAADQFANFSSEVGNDIGILPIAIQINVNEASLSSSQVRSVRSFINQIQQRYDRRVVIWSTPKIYDQVRFGKQLCLFWSLNNSLNHGQSGVLKTYNASQNIKNDGQNQQFIQAVFAGSNAQWKSYIRPNLSENGGTTSEN